MNTLKGVFTVICVLIFSQSIIAQAPSGNFEDDLKAMHWQSSEHITDSLIWKKEKIVLKRCKEIDSCYTPGMVIREGKFSVGYSDFHSEEYSYTFYNNGNQLILSVGDRKIMYNVVYLQNEYRYALTQHPPMYFPGYSVMVDLKARKWVCAQNFTHATLKDQKVLNMSVCSNEAGTYETPVMWMEGNDFIVLYPDGQVTKMEYWANLSGRQLTLYPLGKEGESLKYTAVYVSTGSAFSLSLMEEK